MTTRYRRALATLGALALAGCTGGEASEVDAAAERPGAGRTISVQLLTLRPEPFTDFVQVVGTLSANQDVTVAAEEAGVVRALLVDKGAQVRVGQPIARLDDGVLRAQAEQAASEAALAQETYERQRRLWEEDGVGSEMAYLRAKYTARTAQAGARVLRERLERTTVRAPIPGVLDSRAVEVGSMVMPGAPVARILDIRTLKITGGVPERYAGQIEPGSPVQIVVEAVRGREFAGRVSFVGAAVDHSSRTFPVEAVVPNPSGALKPGMIASVRVVREQLPEVLVVPQEAVLRMDGGYVAYVAVERGGELVAEARPVSLGPSQGNRVVILTGVQPGERLIVVGQNKVAQGDRLQVVEPAAGGAQ